MFTKNKTGKWRDKRSEENFKKSYQLCRKFKEASKACIFWKEKQIQEIWIAKLWEMIVEKERKEESQTEERKKKSETVKWLWWFVGKDRSCWKSYNFFNRKKAKNLLWQFCCISFKRLLGQNTIYLLLQSSLEVKWNLLQYLLIT